MITMSLHEMGDFAPIETPAPPLPEGKQSSVAQIATAKEVFQLGTTWSLLWQWSVFGMAFLVLLVFGILHSA